MKQPGTRTLSRREFLRLLGVHAAAALLPAQFAGPLRSGEPWQRVDPLRLPPKLRYLLARVPEMSVDSSGTLQLAGPGRNSPTPAPQVRTEWNRERSRSVDRLIDEQRWGIVLHWFGDRPDFEGSLAAYLRGFDHLREISGYLTRTSTHFLVGESAPARAEHPIGIVQTQQPDADGTPFLASHLQALDIGAHQEQQNYFVRALYTLGQADPMVYGLLQDLYDGPYYDPNLRTIAIEMTGHDFDSPEHLPPQQQIANTAGLIYALMKRYRISALDIMGHYELQLGKEDPGKKLLSLVRLMVGILALVDEDPAGKAQVFGPFLLDGRSKGAAVASYFRFVRDYLLLVSTPRTVYEWEALSQYNLFMDLLESSGEQPGVSRAFMLPMVGETIEAGSHFLVPGNHEGTDLYREKPDLVVHLVADGVCLGAYDFEDPHWKRSAVFRHRQADGASYLSIYGNLESAASFRTGRAYPAGEPVGAVRPPAANRPTFLHFSIAFGGAWETGMQTNLIPPANSGPAWIMERYADPGAFLREQIEGRRGGARGNPRGEQVRPVPR